MPPRIKDAIGWMYDEIQPGSTLLDVGCSTGYFGQYIAEHKKCVVDGIEMSDDRRQAAKVLHKVFSFDLDGEWPKELNIKYDNIFLGDIIEHLKNPAHTLLNVKKLLKPNGKVFISTPNIAHMSIRIELLGGNFEYESMGILDNTHLKYFTLTSLKRLVAETGYTLESVGYSLNDYPRSVIKKLLDRSGLKATDKFWKITESREAQTYQYKLILSKTPSNKNPVYVEIPQKPEQLRDGIISDLRNQFKALDEHAHKQAVMIDELAQQVENLRHGRSVKNLIKKILRRLHIYDKEGRR